ncbi:MAG: hypothetical protein MUP47_10205 [Phycisphaerae bacterium]|nr:hypothetical protein [Phycisphaerae bacterium]
MGTVRMRLSFWAILGWVGAIGLLAGAIGAWPTWRLAGQEGLVGEVLAAAIVLPIVLASAVIVWAVASHGPGLAAAAFMAAGVVRLAAVVATALILYQFVRPHTVAFLIWVGLLYLVTVIGEGVWLARALKRDAFLVALGRVDRPSPW